MALKPTILFVHTVCPAQFSDLCEYLNVSGAAEAYYMTTPGNMARNTGKYQNLLPLTPDGNMMAPSLYYFAGKVERAGRVSVGLHRALKTLLSEKKIDLIVAHGSWASPHLVFDEVDIPIITYIEFPSYGDHGFDPQFPPTESQRLTDKNMQMLSYYQAGKSDLTLVPTEYARSLFPDYLQPKIVAQFEGFLPAKINQRVASHRKFPTDRRTIGFASRDLSSAKGLETFIETAAQLIAADEKVHFVVIGDPKASTYSFEGIFLDREYGEDRKVTFLEHLLRKHNIDRDYFTFTGKLPYGKFSDLLYTIDLFVYPLKYGSGNWGLVELLIRGCAVIASDRCYVGEMIEHDKNGLLIQGDDPLVWSEAIVDLFRDDEKRRRLGAQAAKSMSAYLLPAVAEQYMQIFQDTIKRHQARQLAATSSAVHPHSQ